MKFKIKPHHVKKNGLQKGLFYGNTGEKPILSLNKSVNTPIYNRENTEASFRPVYICNSSSHVHLEVYYGSKQV